MAVHSKWIIILIGNNDSGKTTVQKQLVKLLSDQNRDIKLNCNLSFDITHPNLIRKLKTFSVGNRSYQEKTKEYESVSNYFTNHFYPADLCFISSHLVLTDLEYMIEEGHAKFYNVCGLFFSNSVTRDPATNATISKLYWDERWIANNEETKDKEQQDQQLRNIAEMIVQMLIERTRGW